MQKISKKFIFLTIAIIGILYLFFSSLDSENVTYYHTVSEVLAKPEKFSGKKIRIMGLVKKGSVSWNPQELTLYFSITETGKNSLDVSYRGTKPDLFRESQGVVAEGRLSKTKKTLIANRLLVKHSEEYQVEDHKKKKEEYYRSLNQ